MSEPPRASPVERRAPGPRDLSPAGVLRLQRAAGNRAVAAAIARLPYATTYSETAARRILNESEGRKSPVTNAEGHPRQHVGRWEKAEHYAEEQSKTKSVFTHTQEQDKAVAAVESRGTGQLGDIHIQTAYPVLD